MTRSSTAILLFLSSLLICTASGATIRGIWAMCRKDGVVVTRHAASTSYVSTTVTFEGFADCSTRTIKASNSEASNVDDHASLWPIRGNSFSELISVEEKMVVCGKGFSAGTPTVSGNRADGSGVIVIRCDKGSDVHYFNYVMSDGN